MITLAEIFQNGMILQRGRPVKIWGSATEEGLLTIAYEGEVLCSKSIPVGAFVCELKAMPASEGKEMTFSLDGQTVLALKDVAYGEIWIAGGQSNMELTMDKDREFKKLKRSSEDPLLRFYEVPKSVCNLPGGDKLITKQGRWYACSKDNLAMCTAVGYYFACELRKELDVPVGIVSCNYGGSPAYAWISEERLSSHPTLKKHWEDYQAYLETYPEDEDREAFIKFRRLWTSSPVQAIAEIYLKKDPPVWLINKAWEKRNNEPGKSMPSGRFSPWRPCGLYEYMLRKIAGYTAAGVIWYQGESDALERAEEYEELLTSLIGQWRFDWETDLPFGIVELAPFGRNLSESGQNYPIIRAKQRQVADKIPGVYSISIMDAGNERNIHPNQKRPVGERLAKASLANVYGQNLIWKYPVPYEAVWKETYVELSYADMVTLSDGKSPAEFEAVRGSEKTAILKVEVTKNKVLLYTEKRPDKVQYAQKGYCKVNMYNEANLAAGPFIMEVKEDREEGVV